MKTCIFFFLAFILISCSIPTEDIKLTDPDEAALKTEFQEIESSAVRQCIFNDASVDVVQVVENAYSNLFSGNLQGVLDCVSDDVVWIHYGPPETIPVYGTYYGKAGVQQWAYNLFTSVQMNYFDVHYFVAEGNVVHAQVREGAYSYGTGTQMYIENQHTFFINPEGKITKLIIVSETYTGVTAFFGETGMTYSSEFANSDFVSGYAADNFDKFKIFKLVKEMEKNKIHHYGRHFSENAELILTGPGELTGFMGKFAGEKDIKKFCRKFSREIRNVNIKYIIKQNNKINVYLELSGISSVYSRPFFSEGVFSFQFDNSGKIIKIYGYSDNYSISRAYLN